MGRPIKRKPIKKKRVKKKKLRKGWTMEVSPDIDAYYHPSILLELERIMKSYTLVVGSKWKPDGHKWASL